MMRSLVPGSGKGERKDDAHEEENITPAHLGHRQLARKGCVGHPHCIQVKRPAHSVLRATYLEAASGYSAFRAAFTRR